VKHTSTDYVAILAGLGIAATILVTIFPHTAAEDRLKRIGVIVLIAAIGAYQLLVRGAGVI
jgi:multidrug transporter EmrE-like cation transporter